MFLSYNNPHLTTPFVAFGSYFLGGTFVCEPSLDALYFRHLRKKKGYISLYTGTYVPLPPFGRVVVHAHTNGGGENKPPKAPKGVDGDGDVCIRHHPTPTFADERRG